MLQLLRFYKAEATRGQSESKADVTAPRNPPEVLCHASCLFVSHDPHPTGYLKMAPHPLLFRLITLSQC